MSPPPPGWRLYEQPYLTIALPQRYIGGSAMDAATFDAMRAAGGSCDLLADFLDAGGEVVFAAVDGAACYARPVRTIRVLARPGSASTPGSFMDLYLAQDVPPTYTVVERRDGIIDGRPAAIARLHFDVTGQTAVEAVRVVRGESGWFILITNTSEIDFEAASGEFDAIAATLQPG